jgi:integrase
MPRKPTAEKQVVSVVLDGEPIAITLHPPSSTRRSWYAYWAGLVTSRSTGQSELSAAVASADAMLRRWRRGDGGHRPTAGDGVMSDAEFEAIQRTHSGRRTDPAARRRSEKSLVVCLDAVRAFKAISGLPHIVTATPDDCARFQRSALQRPKNWRQNYPRGKPADQVERISPNTVLKWSRSLQSAFERASRNAGKKCIRGVVSEAKLLASNPWSEFDWIEGRSRPIRQLDAGEIGSLLDHFDRDWSGVTVAPRMVKVFLWSACRLSEVAGLRWEAVRRAGDEVHFEIVGKWGIERWFRVPAGLARDLEAVRTTSPYVFAAYNPQLRAYHERSQRADFAARVGGEFSPQCLGDWFADRMEEWSAGQPGGHAHAHVLRKTTLQFARLGEDINRQLAADARVGEGVMMASYVRETDEQLRAASNRTYARIVAAFPAELAARLGFERPQPINPDEEEIKKAVAARDWVRVAELTAKLAGRQIG